MLRRIQAQVGAVERGRGRHAAGTSAGRRRQRHRRRQVQYILPGVALVTCWEH